MITIEGLTRGQMIIADTLWNKCETPQDVAAVIKVFGPEARMVYELIIAATMDQYMETNEAKQILERFRL